MKSLPADDFTSRWRIGTVLLWLVLACLLPGMLGVAVLFSREYLDGRAQLERDMIARARAMVQSVDTQLFRAKTAGQALATSGVLARNDLAGFHRWGREVIAATRAGNNWSIRCGNLANPCRATAIRKFSAVSLRLANRSFRGFTSAGY